MEKEMVGVYPQITSDRGLEELAGREDAFGTVMVGGLLPFGRRRLGDAGLNVMNGEALALLHGLGFARVTLSTELNAAQIAGLDVPEGLETELIVYGRATLMVTEHCPVNCDRAGCPAREGVSLRDRKGMSFPVMRVHGGHCRVKILNSLPVYMADKLSELNADVFRLVFTTEDPEECGRVARLYRAALDGETALDYGKEYTRGHFYRGVGTL
jgi:collagenase-like PrtC family protease